MQTKIDNYFKITKRGSNIKREVLGGITGFLSVVYVMAVIPQILSDAGLPFGTAYTSSAAIAIFATIFAGLFANYPVILTASIGTNVLLAYGMSDVEGYTWELGMAAIIVAGTIFLILSVTGVREMVVKAIPKDLQYATISGIGLFIAFIGLQSGGVIVEGSNLVQLGDVMTREFAVVLFGLIMLIVFMVKGLYYAIIVSLIATSIFGMILGVVPVPTQIFSMPPSMNEVAFKSIPKLTLLANPEMILLLFTVLFTNFFDSLGTLMAVGVKSGLVEEGKNDGGRKVMIVDASTSILGGILGAGSTTTSLESLTCISVGAKTGLSSIVVGLLFTVSLFTSPLIAILNDYVTAPVLIILGASMCSNMLNIRFDKLEYAIPAFLVIILMPLTFSIPIGLAVGFLAYTVAMLAKGQLKEISLLIYILDVIFIAYFILT